jgi:hypothetical protein
MDLVLNERYFHLNEFQASVLNENGCLFIRCDVNNNTKTYTGKTIAYMYSDDMVISLDTTLESILPDEYHYRREVYLEIASTGEVYQVFELLLSSELEENITDDTKPDFSIMYLTRIANTEIMLEKMMKRMIIQDNVAGRSRSMRELFTDHPDIPNFPAHTQCILDSAHSV